MKSLSSTLVACLTAIVIALVFAYAVMHRNQTPGVIEITGLAERDFVADLIVWNGTFTNKSVDLQQAFQGLKGDRETIRRYLSEKGIPAKSVVFSSVDISKQFKTSYGKGGLRTQEFTGFSLTQQIQIESHDVQKIERLSREITELINSGIEFYSRSPEYYYTKLGKLKIEMLALATANAKARAEKIARNGGGKLGELKSAKLGVFQIIAQNSSEKYTWMGAYNTSAKNKTGAITVKLRYDLD